MLKSYLIVHLDLTICFFVHATSLQAGFIATQLFSYEEQT